MASIDNEKSQLEAFFLKSDQNFQRWNDEIGKLGDGYGQQFPLYFKCIDNIQKSLKECVKLRHYYVAAACVLLYYVTAFSVQDEHIQSCLDFEKKLNGKEDSMFLEQLFKSEVYKNLPKQQKPYPSYKPWTLSTIKDKDDESRLKVILPRILNKWQEQNAVTLEEAYGTRCDKDNEKWLRVLGLKHEDFSGDVMKDMGKKVVDGFPAEFPDLEDLKNHPRSVIEQSNRPQRSNAIPAGDMLDRLKNPTPKAKTNQKKQLNRLNPKLSKQQEKDESSKPILVGIIRGNWRHHYFFKANEKTYTCIDKSIPKEDLKDFDKRQDQEIKPREIPRDNAEPLFWYYTQNTEKRQARTVVFKEKDKKHKCGFGDWVRHSAVVTRNEEEDKNNVLMSQHDFKKLKDNTREFYDKAKELKAEDIPYPEIEEKVKSK